jgi:hypothetical protein
LQEFNIAPLRGGINKFLYAGQLAGARAASRFQIGIAQTIDLAAAADELGLLVCVLDTAARIVPGVDEAFPDELSTEVSPLVIVDCPDSPSVPISTLAGANACGLTEDLPSTFLDFRLFSGTGFGRVQPGEADSLSALTVLNRV